PSAEVEVDGAELQPNQCVLLKDETQPNHTAMGRYNATRGRVVPLSRMIKDGVWGVRPRNMEQAFTLDMLLNDEVKLITIVGKAGTGKTLMAIAAGLQLEDRRVGSAGREREALKRSQAADELVSMP